MWWHLLRKTHSTQRSSRRRCTHDPDSTRLVHFLKPFDSSPGPGRWTYYSARERVWLVEGLRQLLQSVGQLGRRPAGATEQRPGLFQPPDACRRRHEYSWYGEKEQHGWERCWQRSERLELEHLLRQRQR